MRGVKFRRGRSHSRYILQLMRSTGLEIQEITVEKQGGLHLQRSKGLDIQTGVEV